MKNILTILIVTFFLSACANIQGVVRDKETGQPISSAHVKINSTSAITDVLGHYKLTGLFAPGDIIIVNAPRYNIYTQSVIDVNQIIDIELLKK